MAENFREDSNRAFETAKLTSYWLYLAQIPEALEFAGLIGLDAMDAAAIPYSETMCFLNPIIHEIRYKSINHYIRTSGCRNVLDIACGYSPRGMQLAREGFHYYGADFPVVTQELAPIAEKLGLSNCEYHAADATNYESLCRITDAIEGPICIVVEGLGMYLTAAEAATVRENIARILYDHKGSVYVTTDPGNGYLFANVIQSLYPLRDFMRTIGMLFTMYNWASDGGITKETAKRPLGRDAELFKKAGLDAERCALLPEESELLTYSRLSDKAARKIRKVLPKKLTFVSRLTPGKEFKNAGREEAFSLESSVEGAVLKLRLSGRIDTLSAPKILECFEQARPEISRAEINMKDVTYLSSAGTRVLYLMKKELGKEECLTLLELNPAVGESGLDDEIIERL
jgi:anti-anti-sigma factor